MAVEENTFVKDLFLPEMVKTTCKAQQWQRDYVNTQQSGGTFCFL